MVTTPHSGVYSASKAGAIALAKALRAELGMVAPSVRVALLNPGMGQDQPHPDLCGPAAHWDVDVR